MNGLSMPLSLPMDLPVVLPQGQYSPLVGKTGATYDAAAMALFARMAVPPDIERRQSINALIVSLKASGTWATLDVFFVTAAHDAQAARLNWKTDVYNMTAVASPSFLADRGYQGDGSLSYLDTGFNPVAAPGAGFSRNNASIGIYPVTNVQEDTDDCGQANTLIRTREGSGRIAARLNQGSTSIAAPVLTTSAGHTVLNRTSFAGIDIYRDGGLLHSAPVASVAPAAGTIRLCRNLSFSTKRYAAFHFGAALTPSRIASTHAAILTYLQAVGAQ